MPTLSQTKRLQPKSPSGFHRGDRNTKTTGFGLNQAKTMHESFLKLPTSPVCRLCSTFLTERCEPCLDNDLESFVPNERLKFEDLPKFPSRAFMNDLPFSVRNALVALYLEKITDILR